MRHVAMREEGWTWRVPRWHHGQVSDIFTVIADPTRREILSVLLDRRADSGEASVSEIVDALGVPQPTVSKHLKTLRDAGLVEVREEGQHRLYRLEPGPLDVVDDWLMPFVFEGEEHTDGGLGAAAFAAWAGANVSWKQTADQARAAAERAIDRANEVVQHPAPLGESLGRRAAEAAHEARSRAHEVQERLNEGRDRASQAIEEARGRLRKRDDD